MLLMEAYAMRENIGDTRRIIKQIRSNLGKVTPESMAELFCITPEETKQYIEAIKEHPDWDDEEIAEYFY